MGLRLIHHLQGNLSAIPTYSALARAADWSESMQTGIFLEEIHPKGTLCNAPLSANNRSSHTVRLKLVQSKTPRAFPEGTPRAQHHLLLHGPAPIMPWYWLLSPLSLPLFSRALCKSHTICELLTLPSAECPIVKFSSSLDLERL